MWVLGTWNLAPQQALSHLSNPNTLKFLKDTFLDESQFWETDQSKEIHSMFFVLFSAFEPQKWTPKINSLCKSNILQIGT